MASTRDAFQKGVEDAKAGRNPREIDAKVKQAYDTGYYSVSRPKRRVPKAHRVIEATDKRPFNLGP